MAINIEGKTEGEYQLIAEKGQVFELNGSQFWIDIPIKGDSTLTIRAGDNATIHVGMYFVIVSAYGQKLIEYELRNTRRIDHQNLLAPQTIYRKIGSTIEKVFTAFKVEGLHPVSDLPNRLNQAS